MLYWSIIPSSPVSTLNPVAFYFYLRKKKTALLSNAVVAFIRERREHMEIAG